MRYLPWHKIDSSKWLNGTIRGGLTRAERGDWADLIALAATLPVRDGTLRYGMGQPMSRVAIAARLVIEVSELNETIEACLNDKRPDGSPRIQIWDDGTIELTNFEEYQADKTAIGKATKKDIPLAPEDDRERELRERRTVRRLAARYPDEVMHKLAPEGEVDNDKQP